MRGIFKYRSTSQALLALKQQVIDSLPAAAYLDIQGTPEEIFYDLKNRLTYVPDPRGRELLQQLATLMNFNGLNSHGYAGAGDCDCFTIAALAVLINACYTDLQIVIAGRNQHAPVHIWAAVNDGTRKKYFNFDLTEKRFDTYRQYPYFQRLNFTA